MEKVAPDSRKRKIKVDLDSSGTVYMLSSPFLSLATHKQSI